MFPLFGRINQMEDLEPFLFNPILLEIPLSNKRCKILVFRMF
jgi:hypothetical protein